LIWRWRKKIPGKSPAQQAEVQVAFGDFRKALGGTEGKSWEQVDVLAIGVPRIQEALAIVSSKLNRILE